MNRRQDGMRRDVPLRSTLGTLTERRKGAYCPASFQVLDQANRQAEILSAVNLLFVEHSSSSPCFHSELFPHNV